MGEGDRIRWDERYATGDYQPRPAPSPLVEKAIEYVGSGDALVLACGTGRNALRLSEARFEVTAVDVSTVAIDMARAESDRRGLSVDWRVVDVDEMCIPEAAYDLVTMIRYVSRAIWPAVTDSLRPNGWVLMEQHLKTYRDVIGPGDDYRLEPGELLEAFSALRIIHYSETIEPSDRSPGMTATSRLLACKGDPGW